ncbi:uncharacterized protein LOC125141185 isoform X2 [Tachysurus fulvidraco]|uniref:uncharacterized protein LOC125141185 isoform X2 n=1 Tax=Tachysurus fulvidraco TaxID=1234273 RepID=UPI001FEFD640|nr:uncharacterized protein LOC125141185 isoform X2 [Tachysurus fulvidraco]
MKLLALVLLLSSFSSLTVMEVVHSFKDVCSDFFIHKENDIIIPTVFPGDQCKTICQRWKNKYRFATVYDTVRRILVYSAYTFSGREQKSRSNEWKIEPQQLLEDTCFHISLLLIRIKQIPPSLYLTQLHKQRTATKNGLHRWRSRYIKR